jgi:hypothetical protein
MCLLLVNTPGGKQETIEISPTGSYFDPARVVWDERIDGPLPEITLGKMQRVDDQLLTLADFLPEHAAAVKRELMPKSVPMVFARIAMHNADVLAAVDTHIAQASDDIKIYYQFSQSIRRDSPIVEQVRVALGWTQEFLDDLFIAAENLRKNF